MNRNFTKILQTFLRGQPEDLRKFLDESFKICDCQSELSPEINLQYQDIFKLAKSSEQSEIKATIDIAPAAAEMLKHVHRNDTKKIISAIIDCSSRDSGFYTANNTLRKGNDLCQNLAMDHQDQDMKIWRNPKIVEKIKLIRVPCLEKSRKKLQDHITAVEFSSDEKKAVECFIEKVKTLEQKNLQFANILEKTNEMIKSRDELKKVLKENFACK